MGLVINGIFLGLVYCLIAAGFALILGVAKVFDLAYGSYYLLAPYMVIMLIPLIGASIPTWLIFIIGIFTAVAFSLTVHLLLVLPLRKNPMAVFITTIAVGMVLQELIILKEGSEPVYMPQLLGGATEIFGVLVANGKILVAGFIVSILVFLRFFLFRTKLGLAIRSTAEQPEAMQLVGGNIKLIYLLVAILAGFLGGLAGLLLGCVYPPSPYMSLDALIIAMMVVILGGLGNIWAVLPAALILGLSEVAVAIYVPSGGIIKRSIGLIVILLVLVIRPTGLFGVKGWEEEM